MNKKKSREAVLSASLHKKRSNAARRGWWRRKSKEKAKSLGFRGQKANEFVRRSVAVKMGWVTRRANQRRERKKSPRKPVIVPVITTVTSLYVLLDHLEKETSPDLYLTIDLPFYRFKGPKRQFEFDRMRIAGNHWENLSGREYWRVQPIFLIRKYLDKEKVFFNRIEVVLSDNYNEELDETEDYKKGVDVVQEQRIEERSNDLPF